MTETCSTCRFWTGASCRRYPPIVIVIGDDYAPKWPQTHPDEWCGEWQSRKVTP